MAFGEQIHDTTKIILHTIAKLKKTFDAQQHIRQGIRIAIIGSVNAGKSSLFNALLKKDRAIVTNIAGTTRDVIEAGVYRNNNYWTLIDTAGLRQTDDIIELHGIERSHNEAQSADIILLVIDSARTMTLQEKSIYEEIYDAHAHKTIVVKNKTDLAQIKSYLNITEQLEVSAHNNQGIDLVEQYIEKKIAALFSDLESPFLLNKRQYNLLLHVEHNLNKLIPLLANPEYEIISYHLNDILAHLSELTGKSISEAGMDAVFRNFCVGK